MVTSSQRYRRAGRATLVQPPPVYRVMDSWHWIMTPGGRVCLQWRPGVMRWGHAEGGVAAEEAARLGWVWAGLAEPPC